MSELVMPVVVVSTIREILKLALQIIQLGNVFNLAGHIARQQQRCCNKGNGAAKHYDSGWSQSYII